MIRFILLMGVVFVLPFLFWRLRSAAGFGEADAQAPTGLLAIVGGVLALVSAMTLAVFSIEGTARDGVYQPARLEGGQVRPGGFGDREPQSDPSAR